jgi:hypothetical protein
MSLAPGGGAVTLPRRPLPGSRGRRHRLRVRAGGGDLLLLLLLLVLAVVEVKGGGTGLNTVDAAPVGDSPYLVLRDGPVLFEDDAAFPLGVLRAVQVGVYGEVRLAQALQVTDHGIAALGDDPLAPAADISKARAGTRAAVMSSHLAGPGVSAPSASARARRWPWRLARDCRTPASVTVRVLQRILALTAAIWHNDHTGQPIRRSLLAYDH